MVGTSQQTGSEFCVRPRLRRFVAVFSLANYLLLLVGIPLPVPAPLSAFTRKDQSRPYPCQHHRCGCVSADQCWRQCCCFTHEQKLAWAAANGVVPPAELLAETHEDHDHGPTETAAHHHSDAVSCCQTGAAPCEHHGNCDQHHEQTPPADEDHFVTADQASEKPQAVIGLHALRCHSGASVWLALTAIMPAVEPLHSNIDLSPSGWLVVPDSLVAFVILTPDTPPPRV